ncbi:MAG: ABC transporter permease [Alphaproteobacteria bacterium]|jgi:peptide/nickel transport system permease protein|nr:ABC transporter permease [Alphaproteobacteria bacterium]MBT4086839.1 ABC transporter permease [Alphaproteobacteria bacterium]MBT4546588.1 ABC transporter permease [Alphaproteobacteria bacterium]MBT7745996.1 ABC transporter permease [Alphaproteobacteria bacterium]
MSMIGLIPRAGLAQRRGRPGKRLILGGGFAALLVALTMANTAIAPYDPLDGDIMMRLKPMFTPAHWMGTDQLGRDLWSRVLAGLPWSLGIATVATLISMVIGTVAGLTAAWQPGRLRNLVNRLVDVIIAFPGLVIAICLIAVVGRGFWPLAITLGILTWPFFARVVYAEALSLMKRDYVLAARMFAVSGPRILVRHILPGLRPTLLVMLAFHFADMLIAESALSFLGLGAPLSAPTWGNMLADSRQYLINAPWMMLAPGAAIVLVVVTLNLLGDGIAKASRDRSRAVE